MPVDFNPYSTIKQYISGSLPVWLHDEMEQMRYASYQFYEQVYWNVPETFKLTQRGKDSEPIYLPSGRRIVETLHRYMANGLQILPDPAFGDTNQQALALQVMTDLVRREKLLSRFNANKRYGIMRGDWMFHIYADADRPPGSKISIFPIDPGSVFPIHNEENLDEIIGYHVVDQFLDKEGKARIRRLTYRKTTGTGGPSPIEVSDTIFEVDAWGGPNMVEEKVVQVVRPPFTLPSPIDDLPIYHIRNFDEPNNPYGSSEMRGLERIISALNQSISDEELTLAMDGLGVYATNAGAPVDEDTGEELPWDLGPAKVVEVPAESFFNRVSGVSTVTPFQDHMKFLREEADSALGSSDIATGRVEVDVAESGVAMLIRLGPLLSRASEKEGVITDVTTNMLFNLSKWYVAFEGTAFNSLMEVTRWVPIYGDKIPPNRKQEFDEAVTLATNKIIPLEIAWDKLRQLGYDLPDNTQMMEMLLNQTKATAAVEADAMAARISGELGTAEEGLNPAGGNQ